MKVSELTFGFANLFHLWTEPAWLEDKGNGTVYVKNATILLNLVPTNKDGVIQIDFTETKIEIEDYKVDLNGSSDWSKAA